MLLTEDNQQLLGWRTDQFLQLGVHPNEAEYLAVCSDVSYHALRALLKAGCDVQTALRILE